MVGRSRGENMGAIREHWFASAQFQDPGEAQSHIAETHPEDRENCFITSH